MNVEDVDWSDKLDGTRFTLNVNSSEIVGCHWRPANEPKFVILFLPGLNSFIEINAHFLREIPNHDGAALAIDHYGNGLSEGIRGSQLVERDIMAEIECLIPYARSLYPETAMFLMGHSYGGLCSIYYALTHKPNSYQLSGIIAHAPWIATAKERIPSFIKRIGLKAMSFVYPLYRIDTGLNIQGSIYCDAYKQVAMQNKLWTPFCTAGLMNSSFETMDYVQSHVDQYPQNIPLLFLQGLKDDCVDIESNLEWASKVQKQSPYVVVKTFENGPHDLLKYNTRKDAFEAIFDFIQQIK